MDADIDGELGLKVLYEGSGPTVEYDFDPKGIASTSDICTDTVCSIVAVHGLGANPRYAWVAKVVDQKNLVPDKSAKERSTVIKILVNSLVVLLYRFISLFFTPKDDRIIEVNWLTDLLPDKIPHSCIMTFNHVSRWHKKAPNQDWHACSVLLLESLLARRKEV
jgi:hypothetical protein